MDGLDGQAAATFAAGGQAARTCQRLGAAMATAGVACAARDQWRPPAWLALLVIMLAAVALAVTSMARKAVTYDETSHIAAGYAYWRTGDYRFTPEHPPLAELLATAPLNALAIRMPPTSGRAWDLGDQWTFGRALLNRPNDVDRILFWSRLPIVGLWCLGGVLVWVWSVRLFGAAGGLLSACLYFFSPTMMAHARLVTTDVAAGVFFLASLLAFVRLLTCITWARLAAAAPCFAALFLSKFSAVLIVPVVAVLAVARVIGTGPIEVRLFGRRRIRGRAGKAGAIATALAGIAVFCAVAIWAVFGFRYRAATEPPGLDYDHMIQPPPVIDPRATLSAEQRDQLVRVYGRDDLTPTRQLLHRRPIVAAVVGWAEDHRLLPEAYLYGFAFTLWSAQSRSAFLLGQVRTTGWWYYFPVAFVIKTPLPTLVVLLLAVAAAARRARAPWRAAAQAPRGAWSGPARELSLVSLGGFLAVYGLAALTSHLNIGQRHILPMYPAMFVLAGAAARWMAHPWRVVRLWVPAVAGCLVVANVLAWPDYLPYFNRLIGGPRNGWRYLSDSNVDWGQDLKRVAEYFAARPGEDLKLAYFGSGRPEYYGLQASYFEFPFRFYLAGRERPGPPARFTEGTYVISATALQAVYQPPDLREWNDRLESELQTLRARLLEAGPKPDVSDPEWRETARRARRLLYMKLLAWLRRREPDERIGYSVFIYRLSDIQLRRLLLE